mmetsp:Transcript_12271/g.20680  ORF Transcript_12271/g.20680 Transcript_12271/m.20680 type:complete len:133 (+) Transcript_12271:1-399(+)
MGVEARVVAEMAAAMVMLMVVGMEVQMVKEMVAAPMETLMVEGLIVVMVMGIVVAATRPTRPTVVRRKVGVEPETVKMMISAMVMLMVEGLQGWVMMEVMVMILAAKTVLDCVNATNVTGLQQVTASQFLVR